MIIMQETTLIKIVFTMLIEVGVNAVGSVLAVASRHIYTCT